MRCVSPTPATHLKKGPIEGGRKMCATPFHSKMLRACMNLQLDTFRAALKHFLLSPPVETGPRSPGGSGGQRRRGSTRTTTRRATRATTRRPRTGTTRATTTSWWTTTRPLSTPRTHSCLMPSQASSTPHQSVRANLSDTTHVRHLRHANCTGDRKQLGSRHRCCKWLVHLS